MNMNTTTTESRTATTQSSRDTVRFVARDPIGSRETIVDDIERGTPVSQVAQSVASRLGQVPDVVYALRSDRTGQVLDDDRPIDEQIGEDPSISLTLTPKAHLG